jgi:hypothetical protein
MRISPTYVKPCPLKRAIQLLDQTPGFLFRNFFGRVSGGRPAEPFPDALADGFDRFQSRILFLVC